MNEVEQQDINIDKYIKTLLRGKGEFIKGRFNNNNRIKVNISIIFGCFLSNNAPAKAITMKKVEKEYNPKSPYFDN